MTIRKTVGQIYNYVRIDAGNPDLLLAQCAALSRLIPLLYFMLVANSWMIVASYYHSAPVELTVGVALVLTSICVARLAIWWKTRGVALRPETALKELRRTPPLTAALAIGFCFWGITLFSYGDVSAQGHVVFYLTISLISTMFCLIHVRSAALLLALVAGPIIVGFLLSVGTLTFTAIAINITLVTVAAVIVILIQSRDFVRMVEGQRVTEALSNENLRLASLDSLTNLPNRRSFFTLLEQAVDKAGIDGSKVVVGLLDLDGFKPINDTYGHPVGDELLCRIAERLEREAGADVQIFRIGGDEFSLIFSTTDIGDVLEQAYDICMTLREPFRLAACTARVSGTIGLAVFPEMAATAHELFERADYAMYRAKRGAGRGEAWLFTIEDEATIRRDSVVEQALKVADLEKELSLMFQPIVDIHNDRVVGFEALARWESCELGKVSPAEFIPVAERAGLITALTEVLLAKALAEAVTWPETMRLSFNLSVFDISSPESLVKITSLVEKSGVSASRIEFEITETAMANDFNAILSAVDSLKRIGVSISLDDFGTGYSSLRQVHQLPLDKLKIDRSFVSSIDSNQSSQKIVKSLVSLCNDMQLACVIEGVETPEELEAIRQLGARLVQGYYYGRPMSAVDIASSMNSMAAPLQASA